MSADKLLIALFAAAMVWYFRRELATWLLDQFDRFISLDNSSDEGVRDRKARMGSVDSLSPPSSVSFREALKPVGGAPSWASVRRSDEVG